MRIALVLLAGCLPPDGPEGPKPPAPDPDVVELAHDWKVSGHELGTKTTLSDADATALHGRSVAITADGYITPWHGTCESAKRTKTTASLVEITADVDVSPEGRARLKQFGLDKNVAEYRLVCATPSVPPLVIWLTGNHAMTCFAGVCYLLAR